MDLPEGIGSDGLPGVARQVEPSGLERRAEPRHTVLDHRGWLGRWTAEDFEVADIRLLDISRNGALFESEEWMTEAETAMLGMEELRLSWCLEIRVVRVAEGRQKRFRVHVAFSEPCHEEFFEAALQGLRQHDPDLELVGVMP